ncbi:hypothetical protein GJAV_G00004430 [Gymnothorax javanicus]|nr:hypothetical protein GJAV_G00004430 [Gymnothorax javanicus]
MSGLEKIILIGCLLQGVLGKEWAAWMPERIEALSGSCVQIPCRFEIPKDHWKPASEELHNCPGESSNDL